MKQLYLVTDKEQLQLYQDFLIRHQEKWQSYIHYLKKNYQVTDLPQAILWTDLETATKILRDCPIPAYTNEVRMVMTPEIEVWKTIYLRQLEDYPVSSETKEIAAHYRSLSDRHLLQIIGHELAHQSDCFLDYEEETMWFEEGMVEYISRCYFLSDKEFEAEKQVNEQLVQLFQAQNGYHPLSEFGKATYQGNYASIFYEYWRSFLAIDLLVQRFGSISAVFADYHRWHDEGRPVDLLTWFNLRI